MPRVTAADRRKGSKKSAGRGAAAAGRKGSKARYVQYICMHVCMFILYTSYMNFHYFEGLLINLTACILCLYVCMSDIYMNVCIVMCICC